jgi:suppressor of fused-like protein
MSDESPGWAAIDAALREIYGDVEPHHYAAALPMAIGGNDPLQGVSAYRSTFGGRACWHFVTYGYSELFEKESDDPETSGFGFEMTIRVIDPEAPAEGGQPPGWPVSLLQNLARYVFRTGNVFAPGHSTTLNGPIALGRETELVAAAFVEDPELAAIVTPFGAVEFVQLVGLTADEFDAARDWEPRQLLELVSKRDPALVSDLVRASWLREPELARRVAEGIERDGAAMDMAYSTKGSWSIEDGHAWLGVAANMLEDLRRLLLGRLRLGREATIVWPEGVITLAAGVATRGSEGDEGPRLELDAADRQAMLEIPVARGVYPLPSGRASVRVIEVEILDGTRTRVERVIG